MVKKISIGEGDSAVESVGDKVHRFTRAALQSVPTIGGALAEIFSAVVVAPAEARRLRWMEEVTSAINMLIEAREITVAELSCDDAFVSTLLAASSQAIQTGEVEKVSALRAAVVNSARSESVPESIQRMYLSTLAPLTSIHLKLIEYFSQLDYGALKSQMAGRQMHEVQNEFYDRVRPWVDEAPSAGILERAATDLRSAGVIFVPGGLPQTMGGPNFITMMLTDFGKDFAAFIRL